MYRIAHISDTHIRNLKFHQEYKVAFSNMYEKLRELKPDFIIHTGDIAHQKTSISPEYIDMCSNFLSSLGEIAKTYIILGNHDGNLKNSTRQDAVSPIVDILNDDNIVVLKDAGEYPVAKGLVLNVLSVFDRENWKAPTNSKAINIALFHGSVSGCKTDLGWTMDHGEIDISQLEEYDYSLLGDIHRTNQALDLQGRIRYAGSTIQQNHGESNDKGFLLWEIEDKNKFSVTHHVVKNPKPFVTVTLTKTGKIPKHTSVPKTARLRLQAMHKISLPAIKKAIDVATNKFKPESVTFISKAAASSSMSEEGIERFTDNLRDINVQEKLIKEYLKDYSLTEEALDNVYALNKKYNTIVEESEEVSRNVNWKINTLQWDNLFNYGEDNSIDFSKLSGIVGIFGKNFSGKSSVIDSMLYAMFNTTSKNSRKSFNIINQNKDYGSANIELQIGETSYRINRSATKQERKLYGETIHDAKTSLDFLKKEVTDEEYKSLNAVDRKNTDKNIRKIFGTLDDFLYTSFASQHGSLSFVTGGPTARKNICATFFDLDMFDKKYKLAKEESKYLAAMQKKLGSVNYQEEIDSVNLLIATNSSATNSHRESCHSLLEEKKIFQARHNDLTEKIDSISTEFVDIVKVRDEFNLAHEKIKKINTESATSLSLISEIEPQIEKIEKALLNYNVEEFRSQRKKANNLLHELKDIENEAKIIENKFNSHKRKSSLLAEVPCGTSFPDCKFLKDAYSAKESLVSISSKLDATRASLSETQEKSSKYDIATLNELISEYERVLSKKYELEKSLSGEKLFVETSKAKKQKLEIKIKELSDTIDFYESNEEDIKNLKDLKKSQESLQAEIDNCDKKLSECDERLADLYVENGTLQQKKQTLIQNMEELERVRDEYESYDYFLSCMSTNGISYEVIKRMLPVVNEEIQKVLANIVEFSVSLEEDGKDLNILIKHPRFEPRPLEMGSGAEKAIASMAIRLALLNVSSLPKGDIFILDEPGTALDEENMDGFIRILEIVKSHFKVVFLISHLETLKDCVDMTIDIEKIDGYAKVRI
tara:strand:- start:1465 stop:4617 length:3153 start_codon:yes stop_codon:yes gene_type:complete